MTEPEFPRLMTPSQVADAFGVDTKTVQRWRVQGALQAVELPGGGYRYRESDVRAFFERGDSAVREALRADEMGPS